MNTDSELIKKYKRYTDELKAANAEQENVIQLQKQLLDGYQQLLEQKDEKIALLTADLEQTMALAKEMAQKMDAFFQE